MYGGKPNRKRKYDAITTPNNKPEEIILGYFISPTANIPAIRGLSKHFNTLRNIIIRQNVVVYSGTIPNHKFNI